MRTIYKRIYLFIAKDEQDLESITTRQCIQFNMVKIVINDEITIGSIRMALESECHLNTTYHEIKILGEFTDAIQVGIYDR